MYSEKVYSECILLIQTGASDTEDSTSISSLNTSTSESVFSPLGVIAANRLSGTNGREPSFTLAALRQLGIHLEEGEDIDSFIANLTIPPPPEGSVVCDQPIPNYLEYILVDMNRRFRLKQVKVFRFDSFLCFAMQDLQSYAESRSRMGGEYDLSAFIIPPPPTSDEKDNRSSDIIRRLYEAKEGISRVGWDADFKMTLKICVDMNHTLSLPFYSNQHNKHKSTSQQMFKNYLSF